MSELRSAPNRRGRGGRGRAGRRPRSARRHHVDRVHPPRTRPRRRRSSRATKACSPAPRSSTEVYRQVDSDVERHVARRATASRSSPAPSSVERQRLVAVDPRRRAGRAQLPVPLFGRRVADAPLRAGAARGKARILDTRKTLPGLRAVQRAAVRAGGGFNHRDSLVRRGVDQGQPSRRRWASRKRSSGPRARWPVRTIEVECETLEQVGEACAAGVDVVMLDNMTPERSRARRSRLVDGRCQDRGVGRDHARHRRRLRRRRASTSSPSERSRTRSASLDIGLDVSRADMLLTIDAGNTQTVVGLFGDHELARPLAHRDRRRPHLRRARADDAAVPRLPRLLVRRSTSTGVAICFRGAERHRRAARDDRALLRLRRARARARRAHGHADPLRQPQGGRRRPHRRTRSGRTTSTADRRSSSTSAPRPRSRRSARRASTSAARSSRASRSRWTRCSDGPPRCGASSWSTPKHVIGKSTVESIQSGVIYGFSAQVDGLVDRFAPSWGSAP